MSSPTVPWGYCPLCISCKVPVHHSQLGPAGWTLPLYKTITGDKCYPKCCPLGCICPCVMAGFNYSSMIGEEPMDYVCCQPQYCGAMGERGSRLCCALCCLYSALPCAGPALCACIERNFVIDRYDIQTLPGDSCMGVCVPCSHYQVYEYLAALTDGSAEPSMRTPLVDEPAPKADEPKPVSEMNPMDR